MSERKIIGILIDLSQMTESGEALQLLEKHTLTPELFQTPELKEIFGITLSLLRQKRPATIEAIVAVGAQTLGEKSKHLLPLFADIGAESSAQTPSMFPQLVEQLKYKSITAKLDQFGKALSAKAHNSKVKRPAILEEMKRFLEGMSGAMGEYRDCFEDSVSFAEQVEAFESGKREPIIKTGVAMLDAQIGGLRPTLTVIGGLPGTGKSALTATVIGSLAARGIKCGLFGLEDGTQWITERLISRESKIPWTRFFGSPLSVDEKENQQIATGVVGNWMKNVAKCAPMGRMKPSDLVAQAKDWILNHGVKVIFVDHIGELSHGGSRERNDLSVGESLSTLRSIAIDYGVPIVAVAHFNRESERSAGKPLLSHFAESAYIERMARLVLGIWQGPNESMMSVSILKYTAGKAGMTIDIPRVPSSALVSMSGEDVASPKIAPVRPVPPANVREQIWGNH